MINFKLLFELQGGLDFLIDKNHPIQKGEDRLEQKTLALLCELAECLNEWRAFKFWSNRRTPKQPEYNWKPSKDGENMVAEPYDYKHYPLLEEYVDCLHFILSIGIHHGFHEDFEGLDIHSMKYTHEKAIENQFMDLFKVDWNVYEWGSGKHYHGGLERFLGLGELLGFTEEEIEIAYERKNKINILRQQQGY